MAEIGDQDFHDHESQEPVFHNSHAEVEIQAARDCVIESQMHVKKGRGVMIAPRDVPRSFAEDMSTSLLSSSLIGGSQDSRQHTNDNNDDDDNDDIAISNSQQAPAVQAQTIATHGSRWNRVGRRVGDGGEGKGSKTAAYGKGVCGTSMCKKSEAIINHKDDDNVADDHNNDHNSDSNQQRRAHSTGIGTPTPRTRGVPEGMHTSPPSQIARPNL